MLQLLQYLIPHVHVFAYSGFAFFLIRLADPGLVGSVDPTKFGTERSLARKDLHVEAPRQRARHQSASPAISSSDHT